MRIQLDATLEAIEPHRLLIGHNGDRDWIEVSGPVLVSQGTQPAPIELGSGSWQAYVVGEAGFGSSADDAIRSSAAAGRQIS